MAYAFQQEENLSCAIKRIALELIDNILGQLKDKTNNRDEAIHEARKSFKQLRALLRLVRERTGEEFYQQQNQFYRDLALQLAPLRDAFVLIEALDKLEVDAETFRKNLLKDYQAVRRSLLKKGGAVSQLILKLEAHRPDLESWDIGSDKFKLLEAGLERGYEQGQKHLQKAYKLRSPEAFHEWRKAVKSLWYHSRLLEAVRPKKRVDELKQLSEILGDANDFAILESYCAEHGQEAFIPIIQEKRKALLNTAKPLGKVLYKEDSAKFIKQIKAEWKKWQAVAA